MAKRRYVGPHEVGAMLAVSRQRVTQLAARDDFPEPLAELAMGKLWDAAHIERWAKRRGRTIHELPTR